MNNKMYFIYMYERPEFIDSAIGIDELAKIYNKTRSNMLRCLNNYKKKNGYIKIGNTKTIIISEDDLRGSTN